MTDNTLREFFKTKRTTSEIKAALLPALLQVWQTFYRENIALETSPDLLFLDVNTGAPIVNEEEADINGNTKLNLAQVSETAGIIVETSTAIFLADEKKINIEKLKQRIAAWESREDVNTMPVIITHEEQPEFLNLLGQSELPVFGVLELFSYAFAQQVFRVVLAKSETSFLLPFSFTRLKGALLQEPKADWLIRILGDKYNQLLTYFKTYRPGEKLEELVVNGFLEAIEAQGYAILKLRINAFQKNQQSNYIFLGTRNGKLLTKFKETLLSVSDKQEDGVPLWGINIPYSVPSIPGLFTNLNKYSMVALKAELAHGKSDFHYKTINEIYEVHSLQTPYVLENYLQAFSELRAAQQVNLLNAMSKPVKTVTATAIVFYRLHR